MRNKFFIFLIIFSLATATFAPNAMAEKEESLKPLSLNEEESFVIDKETGQKWEFKEFKEKKPDVTSGHKIEISLRFERIKDASVIPSTYCFGVTSNLVGMSVNFADVDIKQGDNVTIWEQEEYHRWEHFTVTIEGYVPDPKVNLKGGEPYFPAIEVEGIGNKEVYVSIVVYKSTEKRERDSEFEMITFYATNDTLDNLKTSIANDLTNIRNNIEKLKSAFPYQTSVVQEIGAKFLKLNQDIDNLNSGGHPGWAYTLSTDLKDATGSLVKLEKPDIPTWVHSMNTEEIEELSDTIEDLPSEYQKLIYPSKIKNYILLLVLAIALCIGGVFFGYTMKSVPESPTDTVKNAMEDIDKAMEDVTRIRNVLAVSKAKEAQDASSDLWEVDRKLSSAKSTLKLIK